MEQAVPLGRLVEPSVELSLLPSSSQPSVHVVRLVYTSWQPVVTDPVKALASKRPLDILLAPLGARVSVKVFGRHKGEPFVVPPYSISVPEAAAALSQHFQQLGYRRAQQERFCSSPPALVSSGSEYSWSSGELRNNVLL